MQNWVYNKLNEITLFLYTQNLIGDFHESVYLNEKLFLTFSQDYFPWLRNIRATI